MVLLARGPGGAARARNPAELESETLLDAALAAFSGRVRVEEGPPESAEDIVAALLEPDAGGAPARKKSPSPAAA